MRNTLAVVAVVALAACGGGDKGTSSNAGATGTGTGTGGEATTTGGSTTGPSGPHDLPAGATCASDVNCRSGACGLTNDGGNCCAVRCQTSDATCGALTCDDFGACIYPDAGGTCAPSACSGDQLTTHTCDGFGDCFTAIAACGGNYICNDAGTGCDNSCATTADCAPGFWCHGSACQAQVAVGSCIENDACTTGICGVGDGGGNCCTAFCANVGTTCGATSCDATSGDCVYPGGSVLCGPGGSESCSNGVQTNPNVFCDGQGNCPPQTQSCAPFVCGATACLTNCADDNSCASGAYCDLDGGDCLDRIFAGACSSNDACSSGICGINGTGHCCQTACPDTTPPCGSTDCDPSFGQCTFPGAETACGSILESCSGTTQQNPSVCDGFGNCPPPGTTDCTPFICGPTACFDTCSDSSVCIGGDICDTTTSKCCAPLTAGATINVDSNLGSDTVGCCGYGGADPCQTITHAMALIDNAQAKNVIISAAIGGAGGDWLQGVEKFPIVLGWGAELNAPGVYFLDRNGTNPEIIDIAAYSANDTVGYASIVGANANQIGIGLSAGHVNQLSDSSGIKVEDGQKLYLANALINSSALNGSAAIIVAAGGSLILGQDQSASNSGTVNIGNGDNKFFTDGWDGIVCGSANNKGCTITDVPLAGQSSVVIQGQEDADLVVLDYGSVTLSSAPTIGVTPAGAGFNQCPATAAKTANSPTGKPDVSATLGGAAVSINGKASVTFNNGTVQCISGAGFSLTASANGTPTLTLQGTTVEETERAVFASAGTATISGSTIQFNYNGVEQSTDGTNVATINLSGDGTDGGFNNIVCSDSKESITITDAGITPAVDVLNDTTGTLDADNVAWDTSGPDIFSCNAQLTVCTCKISSCTNAGGVDDMDAVNDTTGTITTTGNTVSPIATANGCN